MTSPKASHLVQGQVPDFVKSDSPKFLDFLRKYYEFMEEYNVRIEELKDPDLVPTNLIGYLKRETARYFPTAKIDDRRLLGIIRQLYDAKGTIDAVELFFKIFFNDDVIVREPNRNILRASDGRWQQFNSITLEQVYGTFDPEDNIFLTVKNQYGTFVIEVEYVVQASSTVSRFFYRSFNIAEFVEGQDVDIIKNGVVTYRGHLLRSPSKIQVITPGNNWKVGQLIRIPGTITDTIAKVAQVGTNGVLEKVDIVEYGYEHSENQSVIVSPYPNKPTGADYDLQIAITGFNGTNYTYAYTLSVSDPSTTISETVVGLSTAIDADSYFLEQAPNNYVVGDYTAKLVINVSSGTIGGSSGVIAVDPELTLAQWLASRAVLRYQFDYVTKYPGVYLGDEGQLSNPNLRLQDNYFYQLFSYLIQTTKDIGQYSAALNLIHPAGRIFFGQLNKTSTLELGNTISDRSLSKGSKYFNDFISVNEQVTVTTNSGLQSSTTITDSNQDKSLVKQVAVDFASATHPTLVLDVGINPATENATIVDSIAFGTSIPGINDLVSVTDTNIVFQRALTASPDVAATLDSNISFDLTNNSVVDSSTISDSNRSLVVTLSVPVDSTTVSDTVYGPVTNGKIFEDTLSASDNNLILSTTLVPTSDTASATDSQIDINRTLTVTTDTASATESSIQLTPSLVPTTDTTTIVDTNIAKSTSTQLSNEIATTGDSSIQLTPTVVPSAESATVSEPQVTINPTVVPANDTASATDSAPSVLLTNTQSPSDTATIDDTSIVKQIQIPLPSESSVIDDTTIAKLSTVSATTDQLYPSEGISTVSINKDIGTETVTISEGSASISSDTYSASYFSQDYTIISTTITI